ncbi:MAG: hypothetical protein AB1846_12450, partial [Chloroflexota bacterium]
MSQQRFLPDADRVSVLLGMVLLAFAVTRLLPAQQYTLELQLPNAYFTWTIDFNTIATLLAAALTATGMDWLLRGHATLGGQPTYTHWLLPTLTTFIVGTSLSLLPANSFWWFGFGVAALVLLVVFLAEYVVVDPADVRYSTATVVLSAMSYAIFLILVVALRYADTRLYLLMPVVLLSGGLVALRVLNLRLSGRWEFGWAAGVGLVVMQLSTAWHYWPLAPAQYGLLTLGILYAVTGLSANLAEESPTWRAAVEPLVMLALVWALALWFG